MHIVARLWLTSTSGIQFYNNKCIRRAAITVLHGEGGVVTTGRQLWGYPNKGGGGTTLKKWLGMRHTPFLGALLDRKLRDFDYFGNKNKHFKKLSVLLVKDADSPSVILSYIPSTRRASSAECKTTRRKSTGGCRSRSRAPLMTSSANGKRCHTTPGSADQARYGRYGHVGGSHVIAGMCNLMRRMRLH
jgi:hypothetical protein